MSAPSRQPVVTDVDLMRHGEVIGEPRYLGRTDVGLSARGWLQMREALEPHGGWQVVISSPLTRCAEFAGEAARGLQAAFELEARFAEIDFGRWEGRTAASLLEEQPRAIEAFWAAPFLHGPPGGESLASFQARVLAGWRERLMRHAGKRLLVVAHGGVIRIIVMHVLGLAEEDFFRIDVPHASITRLSLEASRGKAHTRLLSYSGSQPCSAQS